MLTVEMVTDFLKRIAPLRLAEEWDNVGLLVGDPGRQVRRVMTCLTVSPNVVVEAVEQGVDLIVTHHPIPFHPVRRLTSDTPTGRMLLDLVAARVAVYSAHTAYDSAADGINQRLARGLGLRGVFPLVLSPAGLGAGRIGWLETPATLGEVAESVKEFLELKTIQIVGDPEKRIRLMAVACGAAGDFLEHARQAHCDGMLVGETRYHTYLEAEASDIGLILPGHYASERFAMECLADELSGQFPEIKAWPSRSEYDPVRTL
ncbi:MAG: Nif3-like dinuclear metal center hexameric protein [Thermoguttaceae bacterium]